MAGRFEDLCAALLREKAVLQRRLDAILILETALDAVATLGAASDVDRSENGLVLKIGLDCGASDLPLHPSGTPSRPRPGAVSEEVPGADDLVESIDIAPPVPAPEAVAADPQPVLRKGPWDAEERREAVRLRADGLGYSEIGARLGRHPTAVMSVLTRHKVAGSTSAGPAKKPVAPGGADPKKAVQTPTPSPPGSKDAAPAGTQVARRQASHLASLTYPDGWSLDHDIQLLENLSTGSKLKDLAVVLEEPIAFLSERFRALMDGFEMTLAGQAKAIAALKERRDRESTDAVA